MKTDHSVQRLVETYGDLLYDLCESVFGNPSYSDLALQMILRKIRFENPKQSYVHYERGWVLKIACEKLFHLYPDFNKKAPSSEEKMKSTSAAQPAGRLKQFLTYFRKLNIEDQVLLLLKDKHGIPYPEISMAMEIPESSVKFRRQQAIRTLEEWLWNGK